MKRALSSAFAIAMACSVPIAAQWPRFEESGVPRDDRGWQARFVR